MEMTSGEPVEAMTVNSGQFIQSVIEGNGKDRAGRVKVGSGLEFPIQRVSPLQ